MFGDSLAVTYPEVVVGIDTLRQLEQMFESVSASSADVSSAVKALILANDRLRRLLQDAITVLDDGQLVSSAALSMYARDAERLMRLVDDVRSNELLSPLYKQLVDERATAIIREKRLGLASSASVGAFDLPASQDRILPALSVAVAGEMRLVSDDDMQFILFFMHFTFTSLNTMLTPVNNQLIINLYNINSAMLEASLEYSLGSSSVQPSDGELAPMLSAMRDVVSRTIPIYIPLRNLLYEQGIPLSELSVCVFINALSNMRAALESVATYTLQNGDKVFYSRTTNIQQSSIFFV